MLVRFNKGPWHRKVRELRPYEVARGQFNVAIQSSRPQLTIANNDISSATIFNHKIAVYVVKMVTVDLGDGPRQIPSVYPDGALCFEHKETI